MLQTNVTGSTWQGSFADLAKVIYQIRHMRAFGRLSLRNMERFSIAQLYFRAGKLVHMAGNRGDVYAVLADLQEWRQGFVRFDRGITTTEVTLTDEHEQLLIELLLHLQRRGVIQVPPMPRVVESSIIPAVSAEQLITPREWRVLVEGLRRISLAVAQLVGPGEALRVLQDIIDDCTEAFPVFSSLKVAASGYLHIIDRSQFDRVPRQEILDGFAALISTCEYFCVPLIGERQAHQLIMHALREIGPFLVNLGVFRVNNQLASPGRFQE
ncbi:MAG: DUF4388 domain-containing protein [Ktedonobacteraceae bacterium]|nr:DUF4388 domain-containing protein [Ktedonobacteraceae bacterium]